MSSVNINDIFDELFDENKRLLNELLFANKCLNVLNRFKTHLNYIYIKLGSNLSSDEIQKYSELEKELKEVLDENQNKIKEKTIDFDIKDENELKQNNSSIVSQTVNSINGLKSETNELINENIKPFVCHFIGCGIGLKSESSLRLHQRVHTSGQKSFDSEVNGTDYKTKIIDNFIVLKNGNKRIKPFKCSYDLCEKGFKTQLSLNKHIKIIHNSTEKLFYCNYCNYNQSFKCEEYLRQHMRKHHKSVKVLKKQFVCQESGCDYRSTNTYFLKLHQKVHRKVEPVICGYGGCVKIFKTNSMLRNHRNNCHIDREIKCDFDGCSKIFKTKDLMKRHLPIHSDIWLPCDWPGCEFRTKWSKTIRRHQLVHKSDAEFGCVWPECGKRFKRKDRLNDHLRRHNNDKRYACHWPGCTYRCVETGNLGKHMRKHTK